MDNQELKSVWAETIASDDWDDASVHLSYRPNAPGVHSTQDYTSHSRHFRPSLPTATFFEIDRGTTAGEERSPEGLTAGYDIAFAPKTQADDEPATIDISSDDPLVSGATISDPIAMQSEPGTGGAPSVVHRPSTDPGTDRGHRVKTDPGAVAFGSTRQRISGIELRRADASYAIRSEIGRGGMGVIYRAVQSSLDREVAVKTLLPEKASGSSRDKFVAEALVTSGLDHPNVVPVHELGTNQDGEVFLAMKLVRGRSWQDLLHPRKPADIEAAQGWSLRRHIDVLMHVTNAVSYAHSKGICHRDLKPENIMVGEYGETMVMDWGIAVDIREPKPKLLRALHKSQVSGPAGTPVYMAPEQAEGRGMDLGEWTDVYLLGAILHEIIAGKPPHQREGARLLDVLVTASRSEPPTYADDVPRALQAICKRAMAREIDRRYKTVAAFREALQTWLRNSESLRLADEADALTSSASNGDVPARDRYGVFTRALARYEQALVTWQSNEQALRGQADAALCYADEALGRKDYGVVEAQLDLLRGHPYADEERVATLRKAVRRQGASRIRTAIALVLIVAASVAAYRGLEAVAMRAERQGAQEAAQHGFDRKAQEAWTAVSTGDLLEVSRAETRLAEDPMARTKEGTDRVKTVRAAKKLMLWQQARYQELFNIQCRDFRTGLQEAGGDLSKFDPALENTLVGALLRRAADDPSSRSMCNVFETELVTGTHPKVLLAAFDQMQKTAPKKARKRLLRRRRLLDAATCEMAPQSSVDLALASTETDPCLLKTLPFTLAMAPVGPRLRRRTRPPVMRRGRSQEWVALDRRTRKELWRTLPPGEDTASEIVLPVADGSVMIGGGAFLRRHDGRTGRVLGRIVLPSEPILAWPFSLDRRLLKVIAWSNHEQGRVAVLTYAGGRAYQPTFKSDRIAAWWRTSPAAIALEKRLFAAATERLLLPPDSRDRRVLQQVFDGLMKAAARDPFEPDLPVRALLLGDVGIPAARREQAADRAVVACKGLLPVHMVRIANSLLRAGFGRRADELYDRAGRDFLAAHGNADLASFRMGNPASLVRQMGGELFAAGRTERGLELVDKGTGFATVLEGDALFYQRYLTWLERKGRQDAGGKVASLANTAAQAGGVMVLSPLDFLLTDISAVTVALAPLLLLMLMLRLWWAARSSRIASLYPHGLRTSRDRIYAFLSDPWLRLRHTFWSYASRTQRLMILLTALLAVGSASTLASNMAILGRASTAPLHLAFGYPSQPAFLHDVRDAVRRQPKNAALLRLLAEGLHARGRDKDAGKTLQQIIGLDPGDAQALNNLAVLAEKRGDGDARGGYETAAKGDTEAAAVARWNLARLDGKKELPTPTLAHRDRLRARHFGAKKPLWAVSSLHDQRVLLVPPQGFTERSLRAFAQLIRGDFGNVAAAGDFGADKPMAEAARSALGAASVICLLIAALATLWLPFATIPKLRDPDVVVAARRSAIARAWDTVMRVGAALVPGFGALSRGRAAAGAAILLVIAVLGGLFVAVVLGGLVSDLLAFEGFTAFFTDIERPSMHVRYRPLGLAAGIALAAAFALNLGWQLFGNRRRG